MKLFEVDVGSARSALAVLQGQAAKSNSTGVLPFPVVKNILQKFDLPLGGMDSDKQKIMTALKNVIDPTGDVIKDIMPDGSIVLNNPQDADPPDATGGSSIDQMASRAATKNLNSKI